MHLLCDFTTNPLSIKAFMQLRSLYDSLTEPNTDCPTFPFPISGLEKDTGNSIWRSSPGFVDDMDVSRSLP